MKLIDADALISSLEKNLEDFETMISEHGKGIAHGTRLAIARIKEQPTITPESLRPTAKIDVLSQKIDVSLKN